MAQFFKRSANNIARISMVMVVVLGGVAFYVYTQVARSSYLTGQFLEKQQPVQFSHKHHVGDDGIDCRYCHATVESTATASMPPTQTCMNCHSQLWNDSPYLEPVRASFRENKPIQWERVHDLPEFVYFNHSIHVNKGIGCSSCHGRIDQMPAVYPDHAETWDDSLSRRNFIKVMGASLALAGLTGCVIQPPEKIVPYVTAPTDSLPGRPLFFATSYSLGGVAMGLLAKSYEGRPIK